MKTVKTDKPGFVKDTVSQAVLNTDNKELAEYKAKRASAKKQREMEDRIARLETKVDFLEKLVRPVFLQVPVGAGGFEYPNTTLTFLMEGI